MAIAAKQLADGQLPLAEAALYTAPGATTTYIKSIICCNTGAAARTINLYVRPSAGTSRRIVPKDLSLDVGDTLYLDDPLVLDTGDAIRGDASAATEVDYTIYGAEET